MPSMEVGLTLALKRRHRWHAWVTDLSRFSRRGLLLRLADDSRPVEDPEDSCLGAAGLIGLLMGSVGAMFNG